MIAGKENPTSGARAGQLARTTPVVVVVSEPTQLGTLWHLGPTPLRPAPVGEGTSGWAPSTPNGLFWVYHVLLSSRLSRVAPLAAG